MKRLRTLIIAAVLLPAGIACANPTQTGVTGLINVPTADTLEGGNICIGVWGNFSETGGRQSTIVPAALTIGVGSFWEIYGTYPNMLFNNQEDSSGRGTADLGTKLRILGGRSSGFKVAADIFAQRHISRNQDLDGITDVGGRLIASLQSDRVGVHMYGGYLSPGTPPGQILDDQVLYGAGLDFSPTSRSKVMLEVVGRHATDFSAKSPDYPLEASLGAQYYLSPHLTINVSGGIGLTDVSPDWRAVVGLTTCQGIGTYIKPVPRVSQGPEEMDSRPKELVKPVKIIPITSLLVKSAAAAPVSKLEIPVEPDKEEIVIKPYGQIIIPPQPAQTPVVLPPLPAAIPEPSSPKTAAIPAVLPELPQEVPAAQVGESVKMAPKKLATDVETEALEYTQNRIEGVTPLYGMDVKGENVQIASIKSSRLPELMTVYRKFRFPDVMFEFGRMELSPEVQKSLSEVAEQIRNDRKWTYLRIDGHSDSIGSSSYNLDLSLKRAIAVATYLITKEGIDPQRVFVKGMGKSKQIADNLTTEGRRINRRFEILFLVQKEKQ